MPILKSKHKHIKIYRPGGSRYAHGDGVSYASAITDALSSYANEFSAIPKRDETVIECVGVTGGWSATVVEVKWGDG
jgi:hypothetical protein